MASSHQSSNVDVQVESRPQRTSLEPKLYKAALEGDVDFLNKFLQSQDFNSALLQGVTIGGNTVLHIANTSKFARAVARTDSSLLRKRNKLDETPLHCAAKAGNSDMVSCLIELAKNDETFLKAQNMHGETALHEAVRCGDRDTVAKLITSVPGLENVNDSKGVSPLFLATMTSNALDIVEVFTKELSDSSQVSCAGPNGQTALHAAVLDNEEMTRKLLNWKSGLATLQDASGSTPLHYAASAGNLETVNILLEHRQNANILSDHEKSAAYVADEEGLYPIHVAAKCGRTSVIKKLMEVFPDSDELVDNEGRNFLHIAIISGKDNIISHIPQKHTLFNARDNDGNTPLHLASKSGYLKFVSSLISFKKVYSSIRNKAGLTPLDLALTETHPGFMHRLNVRSNLLRLLMWAGAVPSPRRLDHVQYGLPENTPEIEIKRADAVTSSPSAGAGPSLHVQYDSRLPGNIPEIEIKMADPLTHGQSSGAVPGPHKLDSVLWLPKYNPKIELERAETVTRNLAIISVLIATVTFAASFTMPGGYIADAGKHIGAPVLSGKYFFKAFLVANAFAFLLSIVATSWLIYAGSSNVDFNIRMRCLVFSVQMVSLATKASGVAFASAISAVLYEENYLISILIIVVTLILLLFSDPSLDAFLFWLPILKRLGFIGLLKSVNPMTRKRVDVGVGQKFSYMGFQVNVGIGQKFPLVVFYRLLEDVVLLAIIFLFALI